MFTKEGARFSYEDLFSIYEKMGADYGIMIDVFKDREATLKSARNAIDIYNKHNYKFKLVLVAQGTSVEEYVKSYEDLLNLGSDFIAVGGLLKRRKNTARYVYVESLGFMSDVLKSLRNEFDPSWLFALGCYHPKRHKMFEEYGVWGSDYKGWIFQYKKRERLIQIHWENIIKQLNEVVGENSEATLSSFAVEIKKRRAKLIKYEKKDYNKSRRNLPVKDRNPLFIKLDSKLIHVLSDIQSVLYLDGSSSVIENELNSIILLASTSEQQIRFNQLRNLIRNLSSVRSNI